MRTRWALEVEDANEVGAGKSEPIGVVRAGGSKDATNLDRRVTVRLP
ncbi:hypothetical protein ACFQHN_00655 [Natrialbaceae archaeon GCM10025896]